MSPPIKIKGYEISAETPKGVVEWIAGQNGEYLSSLDRGDDLNNKGRSEIPKDHKLGQTEILQGLLSEYENSTTKLFKAGLRKDWQGWRQQLDNRSRDAVLVKELGFEPVFHQNNEDYLKRTLNLLAKTERRDKNIFRELYNSAGPSRESMMEVAVMLFGALALYQGPPVKIELISMTNAVPSSKERKFLGIEFFENSFIVVRTPSEDIFIGQSPMGFSIPKPAFYSSGNIWRGMIAKYYSAQGTMEEDKQKSISFYGKAASVDPSSPGYYTEIGLTTSDDNEAVGAYREALAINPNDIKALTGLGDTLRRLNQLKESEEVCRKAVALDPTYVIAHVNLGQVFEAKGEYELAVKSYKDAIQADKGYKNAYRYLAGVLQKLGRNDEAAEVLEILKQL